MAEEKTLRVQLLGATILLGRFFLVSIQMTGFCMCGLQPPVMEQDPGLPKLSLTLTERLTWSGLQWRLGRQKLRPGSHGHGTHVTPP